MSIHIGKIIQTQVMGQRLTQKQFGALINRHEKTVPDIYSRAAITTDLLIAISMALNKDLLSFFYEEEPMKSLREDHVSKLQCQINSLTEKNEQMVKELAEKQELVDAFKNACLALQAINPAIDLSNNKII